MIHVTVLYFATLRQRVGIREERFELADNSLVSDLLVLLQERHVDLGPALPSTLVSINREYALRGDPLHDGDEVALFPPVSGGAIPTGETLVRTTKKVLDMNQVLADLAIPSTGAICVFSGIADDRKTKSARNNDERGQIELLPPISETVIQQIIREIRVQWPIVRGIAIVQRVGRTEANVPNVLIACSSKRGEIDIYHAAQFAIDRLTHSKTS